MSASTGLTVATPKFEDDSQGSPRGYVDFSNSGQGIKTTQSDACYIQGVSASAIGRLDVNFAKRIVAFAAVTVHDFHPIDQATNVVLDKNTTPITTKYETQPGRNFSSIAFTFGIGMNFGKARR
jgi:hypothetical protein